jgi:hypothetical protein
MLGGGIETGCSASRALATQTGTMWPSMQKKGTSSDPYYSSLVRMYLALKYI